MALCLASPIKAWGGLFNRFNPSLMSDVYGAGSYGKQLYSAADGGKVNQVRLLFYALKCISQKLHIQRAGQKKLAARVDHICE
jgi:hypothetical protein